MRTAKLVVALLLALCAVSGHASARVQVRMLCWDPDIEFPVDCGGSDDD